MASLCLLQADDMPRQPATGSQQAEEEALAPKRVRTRDRRVVECGTDEVQTKILLPQKVPFFLFEL